jgi:hypothetical protein
MKPNAGFGLDPVRDALATALVVTGVLRRRLRVGRDMATLVGRAVAATRKHVAWKFTRDSVVYIRTLCYDGDGHVNAEVPLVRNHEPGNYVRQHQIRFCYEVTARPGACKEGLIKYFNNVSQEWDWINVNEPGQARWVKTGKPVPSWKCPQCFRWRPMECGCHMRTGNAKTGGTYAEGQYWCVHLHQGTPDGWLCQDCHIPMNQPK